ncbi:MAG: hypothetical protein IJH76_04570 [Clostridia bacterium]|nr:hypothetical protein [Clostridia bacterium]
MFGRKKEKKEKYTGPGSFRSVVNLGKTVFKKRDYKLDIKNADKNAKKALLLTILIMVGLGLLLWFLPFTHQFFEDILFLRK